MVLFRQKTVDTITASLAKIIKALDRHADEKAMEADFHAAWREHYDAEHIKAIAEASKARSRSAKIASLLS
jgi:hypothetical protein